MPVNEKTEIGNSIDYDEQAFGIVTQFDGHYITKEDGTKAYKLGSYLGGGVSGVVYSASTLSPSTPSIPPSVAVKILNPVGYRLLPPSVIRSAIVIKKGTPLTPNPPTPPTAGVHDPTSPTSSPNVTLTPSNVWWLVNTNSKGIKTLLSTPPLTSNPATPLQLPLLAAFKDPNKGDQLRELPLTKCLEIWGMAPFGGSEEEFESMMDALEDGNGNKDTAVVSDLKIHPSVSGSDKKLLTANIQASRKAHYCEALNSYVSIPSVPPKYLRYLRQRRMVSREMRNMLRVGRTMRHPNILQLYEVLEYAQESKSTLFLVLENADGGELFDKIKEEEGGMTGPGELEGSMRAYFRSLVEGLGWCHDNGVCHRDLKPENLLLDYGDGETETLKIADFGLSAAMWNDKGKGLRTPGENGGLREYANGGSNTNDRNNSPVVNPRFTPSSTPPRLDITGTSPASPASPEAQYVMSNFGAPAGSAQQRRSSNIDINNGLNRDNYDSTNSLTQAGNMMPTPPGSFGFDRASPSPLTGLSPLFPPGYLRENNNYFSFNTHLTQVDSMPPLSLSSTSMPINPEAVSSVVMDTTPSSPTLPSVPSPSSSTPLPAPLKRLTSVVGSPHYVAPEVTTGAQGYDGRKADVWSAGVILYAMLMGALPFGKDVGRCGRWGRFKEWYKEVQPMERSDFASPDWLFEADERVVGSEAKNLICLMLNPDPDKRIGLDRVKSHKWLKESEGGGRREGSVLGDLEGQLIMEETDREVMENWGEGGEIQSGLLHMSID